MLLGSFLPNVTVLLYSLPNSCQLKRESTAILSLRTWAVWHRSTKIGIFLALLQITCLTMYCLMFAGTIHDMIGKQGTTKEEDGL